jgi:hypothetical protein
MASIYTYSERGEVCVLPYFVCPYFAKKYEGSYFARKYGTPYFAKKYEAPYFVVQYFGEV